ncbi:MAG TPA: hypothetical protein VK588_16670 [Chitinophagaceae bacterium]|nr:hypothetical protein [Chitinophagaceae bacterium]
MALKKERSKFEEYWIYNMKGKHWLIACIALFTLFACTHKKKVSLSGEDPVDIRDFIQSFEPIELPYQAADTSVAKKRKDTVTIGYKVFAHIVPDTILEKLFLKNEKEKIYPVGRISGPDHGTYLLVKALSTDRKELLLLCFSKKNDFIAAMPALIPDANPATQQYFIIDKRFTLSKTINRKNADGTTSDGKNVYVLNEPGKSFQLIMTDALDEQIVELINPIESLPRKNKFSGDYAKDKKNMVSVRDNKRQGRITFFVHFEKKNNCTGELKGEASFTSANTAVYRSDGDFCMLQFNFTASTVSIAETQGCGSHRGVDCVFEGTFPKKKEIKKKEIKKPGTRLHK